MSDYQDQRIMNAWSKLTILEHIFETFAEADDDDSFYFQGLLDIARSIIDDVRITCDDSCHPELERCPSELLEEELEFRRDRGQIQEGHDDQEKEEAIANKV